MASSRTYWVHAMAFVAMGGIALMIVAGGNRHLAPLRLADDKELAEAARKVPAAARERPAAARAPAPVADPRRMIAPEVVAPPDIEARRLERIEPRPPLSELSLALPLPTVMPRDWEPTLMYRPQVTSSATFEAMGYKVAIAEVEAIDPDATCDFGGASWPCGARAMLAFRYWVRGRAPACAVPPEAERYPVSALCMLGRQDIGAWLVANGWAHARPGGAYEKAEVVARKAGMGIFGPPG